MIIHVTNNEADINKDVAADVPSWATPSWSCGS